MGLALYHGCPCKPCCSCGGERRTREHQAEAQSHSSTGRDTSPTSAGGNCPTAAALSRSCRSLASAEQGCRGGGALVPSEGTATPQPAPASCSALPRDKLLRPSESTLPGTKRQAGQGWGCGAVQMGCPVARQGVPCPAAALGARLWQGQGVHLPSAWAAR